MPEGTGWTRPEGGMFIWVTLPEGMDGAALLARSVETEKVAFVPGQAFFADRSGANTIRLSYSCASEAMIEEGIRRLGRLVGSALGRAA
jgi:DNA-binding transcriptional MocR family regulator